MDINTLNQNDQETPVLVKLKDGRGEIILVGDAPKEGEEDTRTPLSLYVTGEYSKAYRELDEQLGNAQLAKNSQRIGMPQPLTRAEIAERQEKMQAAVITSWDFTVNGKPLPITAINWRSLLAKQPQWRGQVQMAITGYADFFAQQSAS